MYPKLGVLILIVLSISEAYAQNKLFVNDSFETDDFLSNWNRAEKCCSYSITRSDSIARTGKFSAKFELNKMDSDVANSKRAELTTSAEKTPNVERWYKFSTYLPQNYAIDSLPEILAQWHEIPDFRLGETWRSPPVSLQIDKSRWIVRILSSNLKVNTNKSLSTNETLNISNIKTGVWTDWIFHIFFSYDNDGFVQVWQNGELIIDYKGPNYYNDEKGPYFKIGLYKWGWKGKSSKSTVKSRVIYFDDVQVSNEKVD